MGGGGGGPDGFAAACCSLATCSGVFGTTRGPASFGASGGGAEPNWNRLREPPSTFTACTLANRSSRSVGSIVVGSTASSARRFSEGRNSSLLRIREAALRGDAFTAGRTRGAGVFAAAVLRAVRSELVEGPESKFVYTE